jgi:hypothetical protein
MATDSDRLMGYRAGVGRCNGVSHIMVTSLRSKWASARSGVANFRRVFATCGTVGTRSRAIRGSTSDDRVGCSASDGLCTPARPALHGAPCLDASFAVSAMRARECRWYSVLSMVGPSVNVLRRTRRKPSTIRGAAPDVVIGQPTAARAGAHPYRAPISC